MLGQPHWWLRPQGTARTERRRSELRVRPFSLAATDACFDCGAFASGPRSMPRLRPVSGHAWDVARLVPGALSVSGRPLDSSLLSVPTPSRRCPVVAESLRSSQGACPASLYLGDLIPDPSCKMKIPSVLQPCFQKELDPLEERKAVRFSPAPVQTACCPPRAGRRRQGGGVTAWEPRARPSTPAERSVGAHSSLPTALWCVALCAPWQSVVVHLEEVLGRNRWSE